MLRVPTVKIENDRVSCLLPNPKSGCIVQVDGIWLLFRLFAETEVRINRRGEDKTRLSDSNVLKHGPDGGVEDIFVDSRRAMPVIPSQRRGQ